MRYELTEYDAWMEDTERPSAGVGPFLRQKAPETTRH